MGNVWEKSNKTREEVLEDIEKINEITKTDLFKKKTNMNLTFTLDDNSPFKRTNSKNLILLNITFYNKKENKIIKKKENLDLDEFYNFYECLINSTILFFEKKNFSENKIINEIEICSICEEEKVDTMLECSHFFCNQCIKTWLLKKNNSCPLCRFQIKIDKKNGEIDSKIWNIINFDENEYYKDTKDRFISLLNSIVNKK